MTGSLSQRYARLAYEAVDRRVRSASDADARRALKEYLSFARAFPALIHTSGLAQATAFSLAKGGVQEQVLGDLAEALAIAGGGPSLHRRACGLDPKPGGLAAYLRLGRDALDAASWIKRYAEALIVPVAGADAASEGHT